MKYIAFYLPQFHRFKENDEWWGKGFTEWTNVKKAKPLFKGHNQPRIPYNNNYYDLDNDHHNVMSWQIELAKKYGVYGFCFYHYWFKDGKKLLHIPLEKFLNDKSLDIPFCISWANEPWTRTWDGGNKKVIMPQEYGDEEEWNNHFNYLLPFFEDDRYIKYDGMPVLVIYRPDIIPCLEPMLLKWKKRAVECGFKGLYVLAQGSNYNNIIHKSEYIDSYILYEPGFTQNEFSFSCPWLFKNIVESPRLAWNIEFEKVKTKIIKSNKCKNHKLTVRLSNYDLYWKRILNRKYSSRQVFPGAFVDWDNSPRRGANGSRIFSGFTLEKFKKNMKLLANKVERETDTKCIFIDAWNEWGEGTYLEPDTRNKYGYLEAIRDSQL